MTQARTQDAPRCANPVRFSLTNDFTCYSLRAIGVHKEYDFDGVPYVVKNGFLIHSMLCQTFKFVNITFPSYCKYTDIQPVPKDDDCNFQTTVFSAIITCLSADFDFLPNWKILKLLLAHCVLPDRHCGFISGEFTDHRVNFLTEWWSFSFTALVKLFLSPSTFRKLSTVWHKIILSKLPSFGFCLSVPSCPVI